MTSDCEMPASFRQSLHGCRVRFSRLSTSCSNLPRVMVMLKCFAPAPIMHHMALGQPETSGAVREGHLQSHETCCMLRVSRIIVAFTTHLTGRLT